MLEDLKQYCLDLYIKTKDKNVRKIMRQIDKLIKKNKSSS